MTFPDTRVAPTLCPHCGYHFDTIGTHDGSPGTPEPGEVAVCLNCAEALIFEAVDRFRKLTPAERAELEDPFNDDWKIVRIAQGRLRKMQRQGLRTKQAECGPGRLQ